MKLERISDAQLLWSLDKEDFIKNQININDFLTGTQKARSLFQEAMKQAARDCMFESEGYLLHCQLQEVSEEAVTFSITRQESVPQEPHLICEFEDLDQVIEVSRLLREEMNLENSLYKYDDIYMLFMDPDKDNEEQIKWCTVNIAEFADVAAVSKGQKAFLREHGECILERDALQRLKEIA